MSWHKILLGDVIKTRKGFAFKSSKYVNSGVPVVRVSNFTLDSITNEDLKYYPIEEKSNYLEYELNEKDIIIQTVGSWQNNPQSVVGKVVRVPYYLSGALLNQNAVKLMPKKNLDNNFLFYILKTNAFQGHVLGEARGAANQASITLDTIKSFEFLAPEYEIQKRIGGVLSAYDNLIENNQKQIKLLEEASQRLYKEWFVDLRFPGHENVEIVDEVPEGWQYKKISSFGSVITGKTPSTAKSQYYGGEVPFIKIPDMHKGIFPLVTEVTLSLEGANSQKNKFIPKNSIVVSCIATVGLVNISIEDCQTNQQINSIVLADERSLYYLYFAMKDLKSLLDGVGSNGATMTNVNKEKFSNLSILCPDTLLLEKYYEYSKPLFDKILNLSKNINYLTEARDRLLPKLMSGEIEV